MTIKLTHTRLAREGLFGVRPRHGIMSVWTQALALGLGMTMPMPRETQFRPSRAEGKGLTEPGPEANPIHKWCIVNTGVTGVIVAGCCGFDSTYRRRVVYALFRLGGLSFRWVVSK